MMTVVRVEPVSSVTGRSSEIAVGWTMGRKPELPRLVVHEAPLDPPTSSDSCVISVTGEGAGGVEENSGRRSDSCDSIVTGAKMVTRPSSEDVVDVVALVVSFCHDVGSAFAIISTAFPRVVALLSDPKKPTHHPLAHRGHPKPRSRRAQPVLRPWLLVSIPEGKKQPPRAPLGSFKPSVQSANRESVKKYERSAPTAQPQGLRDRKRSRTQRDARTVVLRGVFVRRWIFLAIG